MVLWWIGNIVFLFVIIPVVLFLLQRTLQPVVIIRQYADDILEHGGNLVGHLDGVEQLATTRDLARQVRDGVSRYSAALDQVL
ncbi:MAG: hypothetical protein M3276_09430 [Actinomycetota bacterium]|nr:hypothetical protein [Actinomycetota bacterium]